MAVQLENQALGPVQDFTVSEILVSGSLRVQHLQVPELLHVSGMLITGNKSCFISTIQCHYLSPTRIGSAARMKG